MATTSSHPPGSPAQREKEEAKEALIHGVRRRAGDWPGWLVVVRGRMTSHTFLPRERKLVELEKIFSETQAEIDGVYVPIDKDTRVRVAAWMNPKHAEAFRRVFRPYQLALKAGTLDDETAGQLMSEAMVGTVLLGWDGLKEKGEVVEWSRENAKRILTAWPKFRVFVQDLAEQRALFQADQEDEEGKY